jgi:DNA-directed RNA polymerase subunit RPC12/RpoP
MTEIIVCPNCGQKNRINTESANEAKCAKCWKIIYKSPKEVEKENKAESPTNYSWIFWLLVIVGFAIFINSQDASSSKKVTKSEPTFNQPEQILPYSGEVRTFTSKNRVAPFTIKTSHGSNYLVKLKDFYTKEAVMTIFVKGGDTIKTEVPTGTYEVTYASGDKWYGYTYLFGLDTGYSKADSSFSFDFNGYSYSGYTITLYRVSNGNLKTQGISSSQF